MRQGVLYALPNNKEKPFMILKNKISIFNRFGDVFVKSTLENAAMVSNKAFADANSEKNGKKYIAPSAWEALSDDVRQNYFTVKSGDIVCDGDRASPPKNLDGLKLNDVHAFFVKRAEALVCGETLWLEIKR